MEIRTVTFEQDRYSYHRAPKYCPTCHAPQVVYDAEDDPNATVIVRKTQQDDGTKRVTVMVTYNED